jgi:hypothetical protein
MRGVLIRKSLMVEHPVSKDQSQYRQAENVFVEAPGKFDQTLISSPFLLSPTSILLTIDSIEVLSHFLSN